MNSELAAEKGGYLRGRGWTEEQIAAYLTGARWTGWHPPWWVLPLYGPVPRPASGCAGGRSAGIT